MKEIELEQGGSPPYESWKKRDLYDRARSIGLRRRSRMTKAELVDALRAHESASPIVGTPGPHAAPRRIGTPSPPPEPSPPTREDLVVRESIRRTLAEASDVEMRDLPVSVRNGEAELSGSVTSHAARRTAVELAHRVEGVTGVRNALRVVHLRA